MSRFEKLKPHFIAVLNDFPNLEKDDLINLVRMNIIEWKDKSSLELIDKIACLKDEYFMMAMDKIGLISKTTILFSFPVKSEEPVIPESNWNCSVCTFTMNSKATECDMCGLPRDNEIGGTACGGGAATASGGGAAVASTATVNTSISISSYVNEENDDCGWEVNTKTKKKNNSVSASSTTDATGGAAAGGGGSMIENDTSSVVSSEASSYSVLNTKFLHTPINHKLYIKGWKDMDAPFVNGTENDLVEHFNNAMCRARDTGIMEYVIGLEPLPKPNAALLIFSGSIVASAALKLNDSVFWKNSYLNLKRPQGYTDDNSSIAPLKMNVVRENPNSKLAPILGIAERKQIEQKKLHKKLDKIREAVNAAAIAPVPTAAAAGGGGGPGGGIGMPPPIPKKKVAPVAKPILTAEQKILVDSLMSKLRKPARDCLNILCAHDGRETSVYSDALYELCTVLQEHGILTATKKGNKLVIKDNIVGSKSFCIDMNNHAQGHVMLHSIADVRNILRSVSFPEFAFA